jgi:hypothetical protein
MKPIYIPEGSGNLKPLQFIIGLLIIMVVMGIAVAIPNAILGDVSSTLNGSPSIISVQWTELGDPAHINYMNTSRIINGTNVTAYVANTHLPNNINYTVNATTGGIGDSFDVRFNFSSVDNWHYMAIRLADIGSGTWRLEIWNITGSTWDLVRTFVPTTTFQWYNLSKTYGEDFIDTVGGNTTTMRIVRTGTGGVNQQLAIDYFALEDADYLSFYIFQTDNDGTSKNVTALPFTPIIPVGATGWSNVTITVNGTVGTIINYKFYANDTDNSWDSFGDSFVVTGPLIPIYHPGICPFSSDLSVSIGYIFIGFILLLFAWYAMNSQMWVSIVVGLFIMGYSLPMAGCNGWYGGLIFLIGLLYLINEIRERIADNRGN